MQVAGGDGGVQRPSGSQVDRLLSRAIQNPPSILLSSLRLVLGTDVFVGFEFYNPIVQNVLI